MCPIATFSLGADEELKSVQGKCNFLQAPSLRYLSYVPQSAADRAAVWGNRSSSIAFGMGQLAVSWESNCNAVMQRVLLCR